MAKGPRGTRRKTYQGTPKSPETITRATFEAYLAIAIAVIQVVWQSMMVYLKIIFLIVLIVLICDVLWRHRATVAMSKREKIPLIVLVVLLILIFAIPQLREDWRDEFGVKPEKSYVDAYGPAGPFRYDAQSGQFSGVLSGRMMVNGRLLNNISANYLLVGIIQHHHHAVDILDEPILSQSGSYEIESEDIDISIPWTRQYELDLISGMQHTTYVLIAVPKKLKDEKFGTVREALAEGALLVSRRGGPP